MMLFAGLHTQLSDGRRTCTLLTRPALPDIEALHPRMPVILTSEETLAWLEKTASDDDVRDTFGTGWQGRFLEDPVAKFGLKDDGPELIEPIDGAGFDLVPRPEYLDSMKRKTPRGFPRGVFCFAVSGAYMPSAPLT